MDYHYDYDGDGYGGTAFSMEACAPLTGFVASDDDCDDLDDLSHPGADEICDGADNNCDGTIDEDLMSTYFLDSDSDGFGDSASTTLACSLPVGHVTNSEDCDDTRGDVHPEATEICDEADNDCDEAVDEEVKPTW